MNSTGTVSYTHLTLSIPSDLAEMFVTFPVLYITNDASTFSMLRSSSAACGAIILISSDCIRATAIAQLPIISASEISSDLFQMCIRDRSVVLTTVKSA